MDENEGSESESGWFAPFLDEIEAYEEVIENA